MSVVKTIEVDPRVPGIRDEIPFPQAKQCSPELDFPSCQFSFPFSPKFQRLQEKLIITVEIYRHSETYRHTALLLTVIDKMRQKKIQRVSALNIGFQA